MHFNTRSKVVGTADWFSEGVCCHMLKSLQRDMGLENATKKGHVKEFCDKKLTTTGLSQWPNRSMRSRRQSWT